MRGKLLKSTRSAEIEWDRVAMYAGLLALVVCLLWHKLGTLVGGYSSSEALIASHSSSLSYIFHNPINAPFLLLANAYTHLGANGLLATRLSSLTFGMVTLVVFFGLLRYWQGERLAVIGTVLFGCSAWFLHSARFGGPEVLLFGILMLTAIYIWVHRSDNAWVLLAGFILTATMLYVPGMIVFIAVGLILQWKKIDQAFKNNLWAVTFGGILLIAALAPLGYAIYKTPDVAKVLVGLPANGWPMPLDILKNFLNVPMHIFLKGPVEPARWLGHVPVLDYFTAAMFALGIYLYVQYRKLGRVKLCAGVFALGWLLISLGGGMDVTVLVPFLYIVAVSGIGFMIDQWLTVFPRNVFAQYTGFALIGLSLITVGWYSLTQYYVAWPHATATKQIFTVQPSVTINKS
ncbi:MAG TPA: hypothetical protein VMR45_05850 [Patescibacteria group bacterium]|nr:hypothetical protein [Patescibacteria group bacterium]